MGAAVALVRRKTGGFFEEVGEHVLLAGQSARHLVSRPWPLREFFEQCLFIIRVATVPMILLSIPFGMIISLQGGNVLGQLGAEARLGAILFLAIVREQAPLATALLIAGAAGSAVCADLGSRTIRDEISAMEVMGVDPVQRVVMPRILAMAVMAVVLNTIVIAAGLAGGWFFAVVVQGISSASFLGSTNELSQVADLGLSMGKALTYGLTAGLVATRAGMSVKGGPTGVGQSVRSSVVLSFVLLFLFNYILTTLYFNFVPQKF